jgi:hypothetical protein
MNDVVFFVPPSKDVVISTPRERPVFVAPPSKDVVVQVGGTRGPPGPAGPPGPPGPAITISDTPPSSPNINDVWIDTS